MLKLILILFLCRGQIDHINLIHHSRIRPPLLTAKQCLLVPNSQTISYPLSSENVENLTKQLPDSMTEEAQLFELKATTESLKHTKLYYFSPSRRETAAINELGLFLIEKSSISTTESRNWSDLAIAVVFD